MLSVRLFVTHGLYSPWNSPGQNTGVGGHSVLQGIFPTQGLNTGLPHCRQIAYQLSHQGSPVTNTCHKSIGCQKTSYSLIHSFAPSLKSTTCISTRAVPGTGCPAMQMTIPSFRGFTFWGNQQVNGQLHYKRDQGCEWPV